MYSEEMSADMLRHIAKQHTDEELHQLWREAGALREKDLTEEHSRNGERLKAYTDLQTECQDVAFKTKNSDACNKGMPGLPIAFSSVQDHQGYYERLVTARCSFLGFDKAVEANCFPKGYVPKYITVEEAEKRAVAKMLGRQP